MTFDAAAIVTGPPDPPESGVIARSASGALETVPWVRVIGNLSQALEEIAEAATVADRPDGRAPKRRWATRWIAARSLVLRSEGDDMRQCHGTYDVLAKLPISPRMEGLNISNAAAIALYAVATAGQAHEQSPRRRPGSQLRVIAEPSRSRPSPG